MNAGHHVNGDTTARIFVRNRSFVSTKKGGMTGSLAAAALLLLLPLYASGGVKWPLFFPAKHAVQGNRRVGRVLRGQSEKVDVGTSRHLLGTTSAPGHLALLDKCYMTDDCAPGLFMVRLIYGHEMTPLLSL